MIFLTGLLTLLAIAHAGGDHIKGGSRIKGGTDLAHQEKIAQEDILPPPFGIKTAASSYGTKIGAGDVDGRVKGTKGAPKVVQQLADDASQPSIKTLSTTDAQIKTAPKTGPAPALHHAVKTLSEKPGKIQPSPAIHHAVSLPVVQDQVLVDDPDSTRGIKTLKTASGIKTTFMSQDSQTREPTARPVIPAVKTVADPFVEASKGLKTLKTASGIKTTFMSQDSQTREPTARPVIPAVKTVADPNIQASKGLRTLKTAAGIKTTFMSQDSQTREPTARPVIPAVKTAANPIVEANKGIKTLKTGTPNGNTRFSSQDTQVRDPIASPVTQSVKTIKDPTTSGDTISNFQAVKTLRKTADPSSRTKTIKSTFKTSQQRVDSQSISSIPESIVEASRRSDLAATSYSGGISTPVSQRSSLTQGRQQGALLSNTRSQAQSNIRISGGTGTLTLNEETLKLLQNAGGIVNDNGEITLNEEGMKILQKAGIGSSIQPSTAEGLTGMRIASGISTGPRPSAVAASGVPGLRTTGAAEGRNTGLRSASAAEGGITGVRSAGATAGGVYGLRSASASAGGITGLRSAGTAAGGMTGLRSTGAAAGGMSGLGTAAAVAGGVTGLRSTGAAAGGPMGLRSAGAGAGGISGLRSAGASAGGVTGLRSTGAVAGGTMGLRSAGAGAGGISGLQSAGAAAGGNTGLRSAGATAGGMTGLRVGGVAASRGTGLLSAGAAAGGMTGQRSADTAVRGITGLRTAGAAAGGISGLRSSGAAASYSGGISTSISQRRSSLTQGTQQGALLPNTGSQAQSNIRISGGSGSLTLNEEILKLLQNAGGIVNDNGEITLNEEGMKIIQKSGIGSSIQPSTADRFTGMRIASGISSASTGPRQAATVSGAPGLRSTGATAGGTTGLRSTGAAAGGTTGLRSASAAAGGMTGLRSAGTAAGGTMGLRSSGAAAGGISGLRSSGAAASYPGGISASISQRRSSLIQGRQQGALLSNTGSQAQSTIRISGGSGTLTLNEEILKLLQNAGGIVNENGEITLNEEGMKILQKAGIGSSIQPSTADRLSGLRIASGISSASTGPRQSSTASGAAGQRAATVASGGMTGLRSAGAAAGGMTGLRSAGATSAGMMGLRPAGAVAGGLTGMRSTSTAAGGTTGLRSAGAAAAGISALRSAGAATGGTSGLRSAGGMTGLRSAGAAAGGMPGLRPAGAAAGGVTGLRSAGAAVGGITGLRSAGAAAGGMTGLRSTGAAAGGMTGLRSAGAEAGGISGLRSAGAAAGGISGLRSTGAAAGGMTGLRSGGAAAGGMTGLRSAGAAAGGMTGLRSAGAAAGGTMGLRSVVAAAGGITGQRTTGAAAGGITGLRSAGAAAGGLTGLRLAGGVSGRKTVQQQVGGLDNLRLAGAVSGGTSGQILEYGSRATTGVSSAGGVSRVTLGSRPAVAAAGGMTRLSSAGGIQEETTGIQRTRGVTGTITGLRTAGITGDITGSMGGQRTGVIRGETLKFKGGRRSGAITLNEETLRTIQNVGGTVNANGEVTLNDEAMSILQSLGITGGPGGLGTSSAGITARDRTRTSTGTSITGGTAAFRAGIAGQSGSSGVSSETAGQRAGPGLRSGTAGQRGGSGFRAGTAGQRGGSGLRAGTAGLGVIRSTPGSRETDAASRFRTATTGLGISETSGSNAGFRASVSGTTRITETSGAGRAAGLRTGAGVLGATRDSVGAGITRSSSSGSTRGASHTRVTEGAAIFGAAGDRTVGGTGRVRTGIEGIGARGTSTSRGTERTSNFGILAAGPGTVRRTETGVTGGSTGLRAGTAGYALSGTPGSVRSPVISEISRLRTEVAGLGTIRGQSGTQITEGTAGITQGTVKFNAAREELGVGMSGGAAGLRIAGGTGSIALNAEALRNIQNAGGIMNEKGEIALTKEAMQILQKAGGVSSGQISAVSSRTQSAFNRNVASQTSVANLGRAPVVLSGSDKLRQPGSPAKKPLLRSTLQRQSVRGQTIPVSINQGGRQQSVPLTRINSQNLPTLRTAGITSTDKVLFNGKEININGLREGQIFDENLQPILSEKSKLTKGTDLKISEGIQSGSYPAAPQSGAVPSRSRNAVLGSTASIFSRAPQDSRIRNQIPKPASENSASLQTIRLSSTAGQPSRPQLSSALSRGPTLISNSNVPDMATGISSSGSQNSLGASTIVFNGKEINISGLRSGQIFDENLQPITSGSSGLSISNEALPNTSPVGTSTITGFPSPQRSSFSSNVEGIQALQGSSRTRAGQGSQSYRSSGQVGSRNSADLSRTSQTGSLRLTGATAPQLSTVDGSTIIRSSGISPALSVWSGSLTSSTSRASSGLRTTQISPGGLRSPSAVPSQGSPTLSGQPLRLSSPATGSRIPTITLSSTGGVRNAPVSSQRSQAFGPRTPGSRTPDAILGSRSRIPESSAIAGSQAPGGISTTALRTDTGESYASQRNGLRPVTPIQGSSITGLGSGTTSIQQSGIRSGSQLRQDSRTRSSQPTVPSSNIPYGLADSPNSLATGTIVFNGKEISIDGLQTGQIFDENLQPVLAGASGARTGNAALPQTSSPSSIRNLLQSSDITALRGTGTTDQSGRSVSQYSASRIQRLNQGGVTTTYASTGNINTNSNAGRLSQSKITQDRIEPKIIQQKQDPLSIFQDKIDPQQQIVQEHVSLKAPSEKVPELQLSQKMLDPTESKQTQLKVEDVIEQSSESKLSDIPVMQMQEKVPAFTDVNQISQKDIDIPTAQQRVMESEFLPKKSFLAPFNYGIPQIQTLKTGHQTPISQEQQKLEQIFV